MNSGLMNNRLRQIRKEKGLSQLKLAYKTGIPPWAISRVENKWVVAFPGWRKRFAEALETTEAELFPPEE